MKRARFLLLLLVMAHASLLTSCTSAPRKKTDPSLSTAVRGNKVKAKPVKVENHDGEEYAAASVADPLEPLNRATFWLNDGIYTIALRPISKGYEKVVPRPVRESLDNVFENAKFPVRFINNALQGNFRRVLLETEKFLVNSVIGVGGIVRQSDHFPALAEVPPADIRKMGDPQWSLYCAAVARSQHSARHRWIRGRLFPEPSELGDHRIWRLDLADRGSFHQRPARLASSDQHLRFSYQERSGSLPGSTQLLHPVP